MIQLTPQMRILVGVEAVDFRKGIDGLARACREVLAADPFSGGLFVFRNRRQTALLPGRSMSRSSTACAPTPSPTAANIGSAPRARDRPSCRGWPCAGAAGPA